MNRDKDSFAFGLFTIRFAYMLDPAVLFEKEAAHFTGKTNS